MEKEQFNNLSSKQKDIYCFIENCVYDASQGEMSKTEAVEAIFSRFNTEIKQTEIFQLNSISNLINKCLIYDCSNKSKQKLKK